LSNWCAGCLDDVHLPLFQILTGCIVSYGSMESLIVVLLVEPGACLPKELNIIQKVFLVVEEFIDGSLNQSLYSAILLRTIGIGKIVGDFVFLTGLVKI